MLCDTRVRHGSPAHHHRCRIRTSQLRHGLVHAPRETLLTPRPTLGRSTSLGASREGVTCASGEPSSRHPSARARDTCKYTPARAENFVRAQLCLTCHDGTKAPWTLSEPVGSVCGEGVSSALAQSAGDRRPPSLSSWRCLSDLLSLQTSLERMSSEWCC